MKMRCFCVLIVSLSFWIQSVIAARVWMCHGGVCVCVYALTREDRAGLGRKALWDCEGSAATHI